MKLTFRTISLTLSGLAAIISIIAISTYGLELGIDFRGGQLLELSFRDTTETTEVRTALESGREASGLPHVTVAQTAPDTFLLRTTTDDPSDLDQIRSLLSDQVGEWDEIRFESVGPTVGRDLTQRAILGVALASLGIILYIAWAFRRVSHPTSSLQFGFTAIIALLHDLLITTGVYAVMGHFFGYEVDSLFITALLTVMGFSIHDTIVTYDRIRENLLHNQGQAFESIVNASIRQTIVRSLNTSLTLILMLVALLVLGGSTLRPFLAALTVGVTVGTYSSIFVAAQLLVVWQNTRRASTKAA